MMIVTVSFENLRRFYIDAYENLLIIAKLLVLLNNLKYRNNFKTMSEKGIKQFKLFLNKTSKWNIVDKCLDNSEYFSQLLKQYFDNQLRNALEHTTYKYDSNKQNIKYWNKKETESTIISLIDFSKKCLKIIECLAYLDEIVYQLRRLEMMYTIFKQSK